MKNINKQSSGCTVVTKQLDLLTNGKKLILNVSSNKRLVNHSSIDDNEFVFTRKWCYEKKWQKEPTSRALKCKGDRVVYTIKSLKNTICNLCYKCDM